MISLAGCAEGSDKSFSFRHSNASGNVLMSGKVYGIKLENNNDIFVIVQKNLSADF